MSLIRTFRVGGLTCHTLEGGRHAQDGGAMFGVVPKPLWSRHIEADERNRIPLALRCLLVEHPDGLVLVDTGIGNKESEKVREIHRVENDGRHGPTQLEDALREAGFGAEEVRWVVNTHLHFDHAGGNTMIAEGVDDARIAFPNATYVVQSGELECAGQTNERLAATYLPRHFEAVSEAGRWRLLQGNTQILPGITAMVTPGHTPHHQSILISDGGETACFLGDVVPTTMHLPLAWIMGFDVEPLVTLETKRGLLAKAEAEAWLLVFEHDPEHGLGHVVQGGKSFEFQALDG